MNNTDSDKLAEEALNAYAEFEIHLHEKGPFPMIYFRSFFGSTVRYIESIKGSPMIHRNVASAVNSLSDMLELKSSRAPGEAISDAERLECMLFSEYDPYFDGHKPPAYEIKRSPHMGSGETILRIKVLSDSFFLKQRPSRPDIIVLSTNEYHREPRNLSASFLRLRHILKISQNMYLLT